MMLNAKNGSVSVGGSEMNYVSFGYGEKTLVMLPGLGDALKNVKGTALPMALMYKTFTKDCTVYHFSRKNKIPREYSIRDMAEDQAQAMRKLGIAGACVMGISQGGMIAMELAAMHPELVSRLVLANTAAKCGKTMKRIVERWIRFAESNDYKGLLYDMGERVYTEKRLKRYRLWYPLMAIVSRPKSFERFIIQANACLVHDATEDLGKIECPTFVIGGDCDRIVGAEAASALAKQIADCALLICEGYGHSAYEEYPGFQEKVLDFLNREH